MLYDLHLSAYTSDGTIATEQLALLLADMQAEYEKGSWCVAGGDFNKDLLWVPKVQGAQAPNLSGKRTEQTSFRLSPDFSRVAVFPAALFLCKEKRNHGKEVLFPIVSKINEYSQQLHPCHLPADGRGTKWYSIKTRFVQVRCFGEGMRKFFFGEMNLRGGAQKSGMTSFQALATAIAAQVGTGNIVGASGAILTGGPGAIFWMWIIAFFGMATIYAEATLAQKTRIVEPDGNIKGGPVYYITTAFKGGFGKFLAGFFAVAIILALGFMGCMVQSNSIGSTMETAFGIPSWVVGIVLVIICAIIFLGGVQRLAAVTEKLVPIMAGIFLLGGLAICRIKYVPATFGMIFKYAFQPQAIIGGGIGYAIKTAISQGAKRGLFSNEAGMGSTPHAHAQANVAHAHDQGVVAMIGVFIDTFIVLTLNALVIICTLYTAESSGHGCQSGVIPAILGKTNLAADRLRHHPCSAPAWAPSSWPDLPAVLRVLHHPQLEFALTGMVVGSLNEMKKNKLKV